MASLQELPDDELDKLFRSSAEEFEPPYHSDDWNSLRHRLDENDRSQFLYRFIYWGLPLLLLLLTTISIVVQPDDAHPTAKKVPSNLEAVSAMKTPEKAAPRGTGGSTTVSVAPQSDRSDASPAETGQPAEPTTNGVASEATGTNRTPGKTAEKPAIVRSEPTSEGRAEATTLSAKPAEVRTTRTNSSTNSTSKVGLISKNRLAKTAEHAENKRSARTGSVLSKKSRTVSATPNDRSGKPGRRSLVVTPRYAGVDSQTKNRLTRRRSGLEDPTATESGEPPIHSVGEKTVLETPAPEAAPFDLTGNLDYITARVPKKPVLPTLPELDLEPMRPPVGPKIVAPSIPVIGFPALSVRFVAAPDLNFVGSSPKAAKDFAAGILVEYRFLRRLTLQSGVIRSVKKYTAPASEYTIPDSVAKHWYGPHYESVGAVCTVLDIPLNLRYDVFLNDRRRWFINAGVSSYIMQKETYVYNYAPGSKPYPQPKYQGWDGNTGLHPWSHFNFSLGYERNFRSDGPLRRFSWQVEPFLKNARRSTLGYGKIRLTSAGVFFSLRYRL
ncbi:hypothetical protein GCM10028803_58420 [Larkinella knui]|uniref:PorT family protein n=1 Tax=Larkinella knui TaxID=2025310 RepID=A0A3P1CA90_9BACT|nr:hypothetical protein [Larkinella knui]RRB10207.1 hypothetical protein EHT87_28605 [Larkinella knui]